MVLYKIITDTNEEIEVYIVQNYSFSGRQQVIIYESPGSNGGVILSTGRLTNKVTFSGILVGNDLPSVQEKRQRLEDLREDGSPITLVTPLGDGKTGRYIIEAIDGNITEGNGRSIPFTISFVEYRQANIKRSSVNLVNFESASLMRQQAIDRNIISGQVQ